MVSLILRDIAGQLRGYITIDCMFYSLLVLEDRQLLGKVGGYIDMLMELI